MRNVKLSDGNLKEVRALTRGEIVKGAEFGLTPTLYIPVSEKSQETIDYVLGTQLTLSEMDDTPNPDQLKLFLGIIEDTYSTKEEEKNLPKSGPGAQTKSE